MRNLVPIETPESFSVPLDFERHAREQEQRAINEFLLSLKKGDVFENSDGTRYRVKTDPQIVHGEVFVTVEELGQENEVNT